MVKLRLKRAGRKYEAIYHIVATDSRSPRDGRFIEEIGFYNPEKKIVRVNDELRAKWEKNGAVASDTVRMLFAHYDKNKVAASNQIIVPKKAKAAPKPKKPKKAAE